LLKKKKITANIHAPQENSVMSIISLTHPKHSPPHLRSKHNLFYVYILNIATQLNKFVKITASLEMTHTNITFTKCLPCFFFLFSSQVTDNI